MADLTCLIELKVGTNAGIVEESTLDCLIPLGVGIPDFGLTGVVAAIQVPMEIGLEIGYQAWMELPAIEIPLEAGLGVGVECGLVSGKSIAQTIPCEIETQIAVSLSLEAGTVLVHDVDLVIPLGVGVTLGLRAAAITPITVDLTVGTKVETNFNLQSGQPTDYAAVVFATPIEKAVGVSMGLVAVTPPATVLNSIIAMKVGANLGLVSNPIQPVLVLCNGGTCVDVACWAAADAPEINETWVVTGNNFAPSVYSGFPFNSYARYKNVEYAAGPDGIYLLSGPDDDGQEIHTGMRLISNFGNEKHKRIRSMHLGKCGDKAKVRVGADNGEGVFEPDFDDHRAKISRNLQSQEFVLDIMDFSKLSQLEIVILPLVKR